jgi:hypothetical protein
MFCVLSLRGERITWTASPPQASASVLSLLFFELSGYYFIVSLHDAKPPRAATVEYRTEDHHLARLDPGSPVLGMTRHDLAFLVAHV